MCTQGESCGGGWPPKFLCASSLPGQTLQARFTGDEQGDEQGDERAREGGSADSEQTSVLQWNMYYVMMNLNLK